VRLDERLPIFVRARDVLVGLSVPYILGGGIAVGLYDHQRPTKDMDFFITEECAEIAIDGLHQAGFLVKRSDPRWLYQSWYNDTMVDLVFNINVSRVQIRVDDAMIARGREMDVWGEMFRVMSPEDLVSLKVLVMHENRSDWWDAITVIRGQGEKLNWDEIMRHAPVDMPKFLAFLLFAQSRHWSEHLFPEWVLEDAWNTVAAQLNRREFAIQQAA
jgi:hypothetical protein